MSSLIRSVRKNYSKTQKNCDKANKEHLGFRPSTNNELNEQFGPRWNVKNVEWWADEKLQPSMHAKTSLKEVKKGGLFANHTRFLKMNSFTDQTLDSRAAAFSTLLMRCMIIRGWEIMSSKLFFASISVGILAVNDVRHQHYCSLDSVAV